MAFARCLCDGHERLTVEAGVAPTRRPQVQHALRPDRFLERHPLPMQAVNTLERMTRQTRQGSMARGVLRSRNGRTRSPLSREAEVQPSLSAI
jgi:hypothetical protein